MKKGIFVMIISAIIVLFIVVNGYRFTPESAAESSAGLSKDFELIDTHEVYSDTVMLYKSDEQKEYRTVLASKSGWLYKGYTSTYVSYNSDPVRLVGGMSVTTENNALTYMSILSMDENVSYIEAGIEPYVRRQEVSKGERISFLFPFSEQLENLNPVAYDANGNKLYYFGYPKNTNEFSDKDYKWHEF
ncbi:hypothetical protein [Bacillus sp. SG-1]|uniref:hypothetical protein n=1 Tax=Bacillus sp. SG-1 TaxID=161544 RepID=UPI000154447C|nr:hypothetical protein [Bacillus sp. SG-1]EDL66457.1 hypothetical protein BSG1_03855 [Bacillus sp. SG-1]